MNSEPLPAATLFATELGVTQTANQLGLSSSESEVVSHSMDVLRKSGLLHLFPKLSTLLGAVECQKQRRFLGKTEARETLLLGLHDRWLALGSPDIEWLECAGLSNLESNRQGS